MFAITANRLIDGEVVWLGSNGRWVEAVEAAETYADKAETAGGLERAQRDVDERIVVDAYEIAVAKEAGSLVPVRFRERIRALGPTVRPDLGKQARTHRSAA